MLTEFINFISNKKNLILYYFEAIFFQVFVLRIFFSGNIYNSFQQLVWGLNTLWVIYIAIYDFKNKQIKFNNSRIIFMFVFFIISTISWILYQSNHSFFYFYDLVKLYEFGLIFYTYSCTVKIDKIKNLLNILASSFCVYVFIYIFVSFILLILGYDSFYLPNNSLQIMLGNDNPLAHKTRFMGLWSWYTIASFHCYVALCLHLYLIENHKNKIINFIGIIFCILMIYLTDSRSSLLILAFIFIAYILFTLSKKYSLQKSLIICLLFVLISVLALILYKSITNKELYAMLIKNPYHTIIELSSGRIQMAEAIIHNANNHCFSGEGYGNNLLVNSRFNIVHPHNLFLATLLYTGYPGLLVFCVFLFYAIKQIANNLHLIISLNFKWIFILTICVFIESLFDTCIIGAASANIETLFFYLCLGIICNLNSSIHL